MHFSQAWGVPCQLLIHMSFLPTRCGAIFTTLNRESPRELEAPLWCLLRRWAPHRIRPKGIRGSSLSGKKPICLVARLLAAQQVLLHCTLLYFLDLLLPSTPTQLPGALHPAVKCEARVAHSSVTCFFEWAVLTQISAALLDGSAAHLP